MNRLRDLPSAEWRWVGPGLVAVLAAVWAFTGQLTRAGYSPDEEFTLFAVRGIQAHGLPLLPSGLLYDRGLAYSYATWLAGWFGDSPLAVGRLVSLACSALVLVVVFREVARLGSALTAAVAVLLVATSVPFWVSATTARFYAPFLLGYLVCLSLMARPSLDGRGVVLLALAAGLTRWTHELAFTLAAVPMVAWWLTSREGRRRRALDVVAVWAGLVLGQLAIFAVHAAAPPTNGDVMVRRFFLWQVLNLFEQPPLELPRLLPGAAAAGGLTAIVLAGLRGWQHPWSGAAILVGGLAASLGQLAVGPIVAVITLVTLPRSVSRVVGGTGLIVLIGSCAFWILALLAAGFTISEASTRLVESAFVYPLDMLAYLVRDTPWLTTAALAGLLARAAGCGGEWTAPERALHVLWLGWVLWFGVVESGITVRYLLLPVTFMLVAIAVDAAALARAAPTRWRTPAIALVGVVVAAVTIESWRGPTGGQRRADEARPTFDPTALSDDIQPDDLVASTDELACLMTAGRIDAWLSLDEFFRERFVVMRGGSATGTYTGAPADTSLRPLLERAEREQRRLVVVDVLKDMPGFGPTHGLVPRQLAREHLRGDVIAEAPGSRLLVVQRASEDTVARLGLIR